MKLCLILTLIVASGFLAAWLATCFWVIIFLESELADDLCDLDMLTISILASVSASIWMGFLHRCLKQDRSFILFMTVPAVCYFLIPLTTGLYNDMEVPVKDYSSTFIRALILSDLGVFAGHGLSMLIERIRNGSFPVVNEVAQ